MKAAELDRDSLEAAKRYLRIDDDADDFVVAQCVTAAREYMAQAGVALPEAGTQRRCLYDIVCHAQALSLYDRRDPAVTGTVNDNPVLRRLLVQLKLTEPPTESGA